MIRINKHIIYHREIDSPNFTELQQNRKMNDSYYVTLPESCLPYIKRALSLQEEWRSRLGSEYRNDMHFIITDENGDKIQHSRYYSRFKHRARKCGLPELTIHDIRRAVAVNIYKQTGDIMAVQSALGHAQPFSSAIYLMKLTQPDSPISYTADEAYRHLKEDTP